MNHEPLHPLVICATVDAVATLTKVELTIRIIYYAVALGISLAVYLKKRTRK